MLILKLVPGESVRIGDDIAVRLHKINTRPGTDPVVLAIDAPRDKKILRGELAPHHERESQ